MEEFYPFRSEDIPELHQLVEDHLIGKNRWGMLTKNEISFLLPLVIDLLDDAEKSRALKNTFLVEYGGNNLPKIDNGFWKIVEAYLEENNGTGNLMRIMEVLNANGHHEKETIEYFLKKVLVRYSLPACSEGCDLSGNGNGYSLSRDFLQAEKKGIAGDSVKNTPHSMELALQNSVIMEEIFKKLHIDNQKVFRLVSPTWLEQTFSFWRRNARILIKVTKQECKHKHSNDKPGISLYSFMDLWEKNKKPKEEANAAGNEVQGLKDIENYKLQDNPFHCYDVWYYDGLDLLSCGKTEEKFWQMCGNHIEDLKIAGPSKWLRITTEDRNTGSGNSTIKICKRLIQDYCQNLKRLEICGGYTSGQISSSSGEEEEKMNENDGAKPGTAERTKIAKNLRTLKLEDVDESSLRNLLFICPNLKELTVLVETDLLVGALLSPAANGEFIKLEKLVLWECSYIIDDFSSLRQYFKMLVKNKFDSFEHLELSTRLSNARSAPFNLYAALAHVSKNLKTLELELTLFDGDDIKEKLDWFMDLSPFAFPNLTKFNLLIEFEDVDRYFRINPNYDPKFDFGTLKGMSMLEKLEIHCKNFKEMLRKPGIQDWVFEGDRNRYLPTGVTLDYQYSTEDPILCSKLREFKFVGWSLTKKDIGLLSGWFANLTHFEAEVNHEALPDLVENWQRLEKLVLRTEKVISLWKLRPLKEKKKHLRIFQRILTGTRIDDENDDNLLELKEYNGRLFFPI